MKLQKTTLILIMLALGLGVFVYAYEIQGGKQRQEQTAKQEKLFQFAADDIQGISITKPDSKIILERNKSENQKWLLKSPVQAPASNGTVSYLVDRLTTGKSDRTFTAEPSQLREYGLDKPLATINVQLKNQQRHQIILGKANFNDTLLYAQTDNQTNRVQLVSKDFANAVNRQLEEWKQSQPLPSPTFSPSPTNPATPSPSPTN